MARLTYVQARILLLLLGIGIAVATTLAAWYRGAPLTEVLAPSLYVPVVLGAVFWGLLGGLIAAGVASVVYGVVLADQVAVVGLGQFALLLTNRVLFYFFLAVILAIGVQFIEERLRKLEIYDQIDDLTGLYNASFFLENTDLETSRSNRYQTIFSVVDLDVLRGAFEGLSARRTKRVVKDLGSRIQAAVRQVDRPARVDAPDRERFLLILPETGREGAEIFAERLHAAALQFLSERGCRPDGNVTIATITYPDDPEQLARVRDEVAEVESKRRSVRDEAPA